MSDLQIGIVGLGVGEQHIEGFHGHPGARVVALCDFDREKLSKVSARYPGMGTTADAADVLTDPEIDVVSIASYDNFHHEQIVMALQHDKHVFVEKPLCLREEQAVEIRALLNERPWLRMSSNLILRRSPRFRWLKSHIEAGGLGQLFSVEAGYEYGRLHKIVDGWRGKIDEYAIILGGGTHMIDLLLWITGDEINEVFSYGNAIATKGTGFRYDDFVAATLKFRSGLVGQLSANSGCVHPHFHRLAVYGTDATFFNGLDYGQLFESRDPADRPQVVADEYPGVHKGDLLFNFVDAVVNGAKLDVTPDDIFRCMAVCFAIERSRGKGTPEAVNDI